MENLPEDFLLKIFSFLDHQNLATAQQVCRNWKVPASNDMLWLNLFRERWGEDDAAFYAPAGSKSWKDVYEVQDRCGRVGLGLKIIREGVDYYLVHQGEIQRHLGSRRQRKRDDICPSNFTEEEKSSQGILDRILFFIGDLEVASADAKRGRLL
ncbi:hypothetical protein CICLE_v10022664mg [Citrus x clementina]|uniref:F-box protein n=2 Tax=Citrus clementina TaxID=85681 RepID=V4TWX0_CITCL|nr:uncharacterized protein LOC18048389 [Citrus x clementina]ESR54416.1 hypothetical protein CICLE_v10022664mg [Citrus x clementina]